MFPVFHHLQKGQVTQTTPITMLSKEREDVGVLNALPHYFCKNDDKSNHHQFRVELWPLNNESIQFHFYEAQTRFESETL